MKYSRSFKVFIILSFLSCFISDLNAQTKIDKQIIQLKNYNYSEKKQLSTRIGLYRQYLQNKDSEKLFSLIINNFESKMGVGFNPISLEINSEPEEFHRKFSIFQKRVNDRIGTILEAEVTQISRSKDCIGSLESEECLFVSLKLKKQNNLSIWWDKSYWFNAYYYNKEWYFTPLNWIDI